MRACLKAATAALFALPFAGAPVSAGPVADDALRAEQFLAQGKTVEALALLESAFNAVWDSVPLGFSEAVFVTGRPSGFGIFETRANAVFKSGEPMMVYAEPYGYGYGDLDGQFTIKLTADYQLKNATGAVLTAQDNFASMSMVSHRRNKEFQLFITYKIDGLPVGDYVLVTTIRDQNSTKSGGFELPFTISN
jgi:hypothetical protein